MSKYLRLLGEAPVDADFESFGSSLAQSIDKASGDAYLIGSIAKQLGVSKQEVVSYIASTLYKNVFTDGRNEASTEDEYRQAISNALIQVVSDIEKRYNIKVKNANSSVRGYTSRVISSLAQSTKDFSQPVSVQKAVKAVQVAAAAEPEVKAQPQAVEQPQVKAPVEEVKTREQNLGEEMSLAEQYFETLEESIAKINKRSARYGLPEVRINKISEEFTETKKSKVKYKNIKFTIDIPTLQLPGGWEFIASIDHMGEGNIINTSPEVELTQSLHDRFGTAKASTCDHCGKVRNRTTTYLVRNSDGQIKRVGKQCLKDYLPGGVSSADKVLQLTKLWSDIFAEIRKLESEQGSSGENGGFGGARNYASLKDMVGRAIGYISTYGFTKSSNRDNDYFMDSQAATPTSTRIKNSFDPSPGKKSEQELKAMGRIIELENNPAETEEAIKWIQTYIDKQLKGDTSMRDYFSNLKVMFDNPDSAVKIKYAGYIASAVNTFFKNKTGQAEAASRKEGGFVGIQGSPIGELKPLDRTKLKKQGADITKPPYNGPINMTALTDTVAYGRESYGYYDSGVSYRSSLVDDDGNVYTLFSSSDDGFKKGDKVKLIRGIIKKHNEYTPRNSDKPIKQNLLSRAVFTEKEREQVNEDDCTSFNSLLSRLDLLHS